MLVGFDDLHYFQSPWARGGYRQAGIVPFREIQDALSEWRLIARSQALVIAAEEERYHHILLGVNSAVRLLPMNFTTFGLEVYRVLGAKSALYLP